eukprot:gene4875-9719_t
MLKSFTNMFIKGGSTTLALKNCFPGCLVKEEDWDEFIHLFTNDTVTNSSSAMRLSKFIIVVEGEMAVCVSSIADPSEDNWQHHDEWLEHIVSITTESADQTSSEATAFHKSDTFLLFPNENTDISDKLIFEHIEVSCRLQANTKKLSVYSATQESISNFIQSKSYLASISPVLNIKLSDFLKNEVLLKGMSAQQVDTLGPFLRVVVIDEGDYIVKQGEAPFDFDGGLIGILLSGELITMDPSKSDVTQQNFQLSPYSLSGKAVMIEGAVRSKNRASLVASRSSFSNKVLVTDNAVDYSSIGTPIYPGSLVVPELGLFTKCVATKSIVASQCCVMGLLTRKSLIKLSQMKSPVMRTMHSNFVHDILAPMKAQMPILRDLTEGELRRLALKMVLESVEEGTPAVRTGDIADKFYIIVSGQMKKFSPSEPPEKARILEQGSYFGEVSLVTAAPRRTTVVANTKCQVLCILGDHFRSIFDAALEKSSEMVIQTEGVKVELINILRNTRGYDAFMTFLEAEHSTESLLFWRAVDRYEDLCDRLSSHEKESQKSVDNALLFEMASSIMRRFVHDGAVNQVNLSGNLRKTVEKDYLKVQQSLDENINIPIIAPEDSEDICYKKLFIRVKSEVYGLLKNDNHSRWKGETSFEAFITSMQS